LAKLIYQKRELEEQRFVKVAKEDTLKKKGKVLDIE